MLCIVQIDVIWFRCVLAGMRHLTDTTPWQQLRDARRADRNDSLTDGASQTANTVYVQVRPLPFAAVQQGLSLC